MPLWGSSDAASNGVITAAAQFKLTPNSANRDALYGNTTQDAITPGQIVGMYAVDSTEMQVVHGRVVEGIITFPGSGYLANATVAFSSNNTGSSAAANATANASGRVSAINITTQGSGYTTGPVVTISAPAAQTFSGNTSAVTVGNTTNTGWISLGTNRAFFVNNDIVTYLVAASNTALGGLTNNTTYAVQTVNSSAIQLLVSVGGAAVNISSVPTSAQAGHSITGETATGVVDTGGAKDRGIAHSGWNIRTVGTGGRAGRVQFETLVAMGITTDGSDDAVIHDS